MSTTVDNRVLEMRFDNKQFEKNVATSMSTLEKLKQKLNLSGASKGLNDVRQAAKKFDMSGMSSAVDTVSARFSALQVVGVTTLANITNSAVNTGRRMISALTIDPVKTGFQEYETQIGAVQTILANTQHEGTNLQQVNRALDELNTYADKTIYNFTEMTRNIGTFTAAGVNLRTSVDSIKGIANLAAVSGSTSMQASTAMYQLSQALAAGKVSLMDWNSVVNAGMGGKVFQDALIRTSELLGTGAKQAVKTYGSFRESLTQGEWLTTEVLTETLKQFAGAYSEADLIAQGFTEAQAKEIAQMAKTAEEAATKVKTFTQLWDTLKESAQSGWTQSWEIMVGDFEEARATLTKVSITLGAMIGASADARNKMLQGWKNLGGRNALIESFENTFKGIMSIITPVKEAFRDIFPPITSKQLFKFTEGLRDLTSKLILSGENVGKVKRVFKGLFSIMDIGKKAITSVVKAFAELLNSEGVASIGGFILDMAASIGDFFTSLNESFDTGGFSGGLTKIVSGTSNILKSATEGLQGFGNIFSSIGRGVSKVASEIWNTIKTVFTWITDNVSGGDIFAGLAGSGIFILATKLGGAFDKVEEIVNKVVGIFKGEKTDSIKENFCDILDSVHGALQSFTTGIKATTLVSIAIAIGILSASLKSISELKGADITKSLFAISVMMGILSLGFRSLTKALGKFDSKGIVKSGVTLILLATAIDILSDSMIKLSGLSWGGIAKGLVGIGVGIIALSTGLRIIGNIKIPLSTSIALLALAESCKVLGDAVQKFGSMSWEEIGHGLVGMGGALGELVAAVSILGKTGGFKSILGSVGILIAVQALDEISENLKKFGSMSWTEIERGLVGMGGALLEIGGVVGALGKIAGFSSIFASGAILMVVHGLGDLVNAFKDFGSMSWTEIGRGLVGMGGALSEVAVISGILGKLTGLSGILGAGAILLVVQSLAKLAEAFKDFGSMSWTEIGRGLVGMGGALSEVAIISGTLGTLTGLSGILGAGALLLGIQGLGDLADALKKFGEMTWEEIKQGLVGMGGALLEVAVISGTLGTLGGPLAIVGSGALLVGIQGLGDLADALKKFGEMNWEEIDRGLTAMGAALGEIALGGFLNTLSIIGSFSISEMAEPLGILADSVKKWAGVVVPEGIGTQLQSLASGVMNFTFSGFGASAIAEVAEPLGQLATSVKKWDGVTVPENLETKLTGLSNGIKAFTWAFMGGWSIGTVAEPLGSLAASVKKWDGVTVPETLETQLISLSNGVKAFTWAFMGGWSIDAIIEPLGSLAASVKKWDGVTVPENLETQLTGLSNGVKAFTWAFMGGWSIDAIIEPLSSLATSVKKWNGVTVPENLKTQLADLADGVKAFTGIGDISSATNGMESITSSASKLSGINFQYIKSGMSSLVAAFQDLSEIDTSGISVLKSAASSIDEIANSMEQSASRFLSVGSKMADSISRGFASRQSSLLSVISGTLTKLIHSVTAKSSVFRASGVRIITSLIDGIRSRTPMIMSIIISALSSAVGAISGFYGSFYSSGVFLGTGLVIGINSMKGAAYSAGYELGQAAAQGENDGQESASPSKLTIQAGKWLGEGLIIGINKMTSKVYKSGYGLGDTAATSLSSAISKISDVINSDINTEPTIRPVLDLSDVKAGAGAISGMFNNGSIGVVSNINAISSMMSRRNQNGVNDEVVTAIDKLRKNLGNVGNNTYNINGITYDDGSNVSEAVESLIRAARVERRR